MAERKVEDNVNSGGVLDNTFKKERNSNLELFRIIVMLLIVAHHYVVNSGLTAADGPIFANPLSFKSIFLLLFGMWGKTGINCFVLITGYFMCKSSITLKKFLKLLLEVYLYRIIFYVIFLVSGYQPFSLTGLVKIILPFTSVSTGFTGCYLLFFLFIPFLNILIGKLTERQHILLNALCLLIYTLIGTVPTFTVTMNYVSWFIVLYFMASYIRLYPEKWFEDRRITGFAALFFVICSMCSVVVMQWISVKIGRTGLQYWFVADSNKILAVLTAISAFCFFKNLKIKNSRFINTVAASTFGVLLIHANSDAMRKWLWKDVLNNVGMYDSNLIYVHAFGSVICVFAICAIIDILRRRFLEEPFFQRLDRKKRMASRKRSAENE